MAEGSRTAGHTTTFAGILCMHRITEGFMLRLTGNEPAGEDQMEKQGWWPDSRNPVQKHEGRKTKAQYQNSTVLLPLHCSEAFGLLMLLVLRLRALKDFKPTWKPLWPNEPSEEPNPTTESDMGQKILHKVSSSCIYIYLYIIFVYIYSYLYLNKDYWKPKCDEHSRLEKKKSESQSEVRGSIRETPKNSDQRPMYLCITRFRIFYASSP